MVFPGLTEGAGKTRNEIKMQRTSSQNDTGANAGCSADGGHGDAGTKLAILVGLVGLALPRRRRARMS